MAFELEFRIGKLGTIRVPVVEDGERLCGGLGTVELQNAQITTPDFLGFVATILVEWLDLVDAQFDFDAGPEYSPEDGLHTAGPSEVDDDEVEWDTIDPETGEVVEEPARPESGDLDLVRAASQPEPEEQGGQSAEAPQPKASSEEVP